MSIPKIIFLHGLGLDRQFWTPLITAFGDTADCTALDLPGFGDNAGHAPLTVEETVDWLEEQLIGSVSTDWHLAGHSMSGKFAAALAARIAQGVSKLTSPSSLVLIAPSPPAPEPMDEEKRAEMKAWWHDGLISERDARSFVDANVAGQVSDARMKITMDSVMRSNADAWSSWLDRGSREDWSEVIGVLDVPVLIVTGEQDSHLGIEAQQRLTRPHFRDAHIEDVASASHFVPLEQPSALAQLIKMHLERLSSGSSTALPAAFAALLASSRVSRRTWQVMLQRMAEPTRVPDMFTSRELAVLDALSARLLPQGDAPIDLVRRCIVELANGAGDGWRPAELPTDIDAWHLALKTLDEVCPDFAGLAPSEQDAFIERLSGGETRPASLDDPLSGPQLQTWLSELRRMLARHWIAHPATLAAIGYDGFAVGGDGVRKTGYRLTRANQREEWQLPSAEASAGVKP